MQSAIQTAFRIQLLQLKELSAIKFKKKKKENLNPHWTFSELFISLCLLGNKMPTDMEMLMLHNLISKMSIFLCVKFIPHLQLTELYGNLIGKMH